MMKSSCIAASCIDAQTPVKVSFTKLHEWAQADKEFLRMLTINSTDDTNSSSSSSSLPSSCISSATNSQQSYAYRQRYLRSYTFSTKESAAQRTKKKWLKHKQNYFKDNRINNSKQERFIASGSCCSFIDVVFKFLFLCVAKVDVHES